MLYNAFEQVTKSSFRKLVESGYTDFVLQRFEWPDVRDKAGFLLTPYEDKESADQHAHQLGAKEGRAMQLPQDADKIESMLEDQATVSFSIVSRRKTEFRALGIFLYSKSME